MTYIISLKTFTKKIVLPFRFLYDTRHYTLSYRFGRSHIERIHQPTFFNALFPFYYEHKENLIYFT